MSNNVNHVINIKNVTSNSIYGLILGLVLTLVPISTIVEVIILLIAFILILSNGLRVYAKMVNKETSSNQLLLDVLGVFMGFILLVYSNLVVTIIVSIYLIAEPVIELALVKFDKAALMVEVPKITLGIVLLISGVAVFNILFKIVGIILISASSLYFGFNYYLYKKSGVKVIK